MTKRVVLAGWGQVTQTKHQTRDRLLDPVGLMAAACEQAFEMTGARDIRCAIDGLMVVRVMSVYYAAVDRALADALGIMPRYSAVSSIGGNSPQSLINKAAGMIARNELESVLIVGAETYYRRDKRGKTAGSALFQGFPPDYKEDDIIGSTEVESRHGMSLPVHGFPLFETALWAASGLDIQAYRRRIAELWSGFSRVAATHPNAWSRTPRTVDEIAQPSDTNRFIAFPYTKLMNPLISADLGAAVLVMSENTARRYARAGRNTVYFRGGGFARDRQRFMIEKSDFTASPALKRAAQKALSRGSLTLDAMHCFDLYSCFPSSVRIAQHMLGLREDDPRPLTLTGGLGFFGGPGNNYSLHAVATLAEAIAAGKTGNGLITALGWFMHKHAAGVYSAEPGDEKLAGHDLEDEQSPDTGNPPVDYARQPSGTGIIETYTVIYSRQGAPSHAIIYGKTQDGLRFVAASRDVDGTIPALVTQNHVGNKVQLIWNPKQQATMADLV